jgi:hypothetical protein
MPISVVDFLHGMILVKGDVELGEIKNADYI